MQLCRSCDARRPDRWCSNREFVVPDDVKVLAPYVLGHRLVLQRRAGIDALGAGSVVVAEVLATVPVPVRG